MKKFSSSQPQQLSGLTQQGYRKAQAGRSLSNNSYFGKNEGEMFSHVLRSLFTLLPTLVRRPVHSDTAQPGLTLGLASLIPYPFPLGHTIVPGIRGVHSWSDFKARQHFKPLSALAEVLQSLIYEATSTLPLALPSYFQATRVPQDG